MAYRVGDADAGGRVDGNDSDRLNRMVAGAFGAVYLLVGLLGFFGHKDGEDFAGREGHSLLGFQVNNLHNIVHLAIGAALLAAAAAGWRAARSANLTVGVVYLALGIIGFFIQKTDVNIVALNVNDHFLHLISGAILTAVALSGRKRTAVDRTA
jgi:hypothetical protein